MIHGLGAERTFVPTALWVDLCGGATGQVETPRREVGLALVEVRGYFKITRLTRSWYLI